ncbi:MAG: hypothetical protein AAFQ94_27160, partial [Bacteroidota bacterium]
LRISLVFTFSVMPTISETSSIRRLEKETKLDVETLNVSSFVKDIHVKDSLIIHDQNDKVIPIERSKNVHRNWDVSRFKTVNGTGHFRILRTKKVISMVLNYLEDTPIDKNEEFN